MPLRPFLSCYISPLPSGFPSALWVADQFSGENFQSFFAVGSIDTLSVTPIGNGLSPILKSVPDCSMSYVETFCFETPSFVAPAKVSAVGDLIRYLTLLPSFSV